MPQGVKVLARVSSASRALRPVYPALALPLNRKGKKHGILLSAKTSKFSSKKSSLLTTPTESHCHLLTFIPHSPLPFCHYSPSSQPSYRVCALLQCCLLGLCSQKRGRPPLTLLTFKRRKLAATNFRRAQDHITTARTPYRTSTLGLNTLILSISSCFAITSIFLRAL